MGRGASPVELRLLPKTREKPGERVFITELAAFLGCAEQVVLRFARPMGVLEMRRSTYGEVKFVTPRAAMRLIIAVRGWQGKIYSEGTDYHLRQLHEQARTMARQQRKRAERVARGLPPGGVRPKRPVDPFYLSGVGWKKPRDYCSHLRFRRGGAGCRSTWFDPTNKRTREEWEGNPLHTLPCCVWVVLSEPHGDTQQAGYARARCVNESSP